MKTLSKPRIEDIKKLSLFKNIPSEEINSIVEVLGKQQYEKDEFIITEEEPGEVLYILVKGSLYVTKNINGNKQEILSLIENPGDLFGEMALVEDKPRCAGVVASEKCEVFTIRKEDFLNLVGRLPKFTLEVARNISNYLRNTDQRLIQVLQEKNAELTLAYQKLQETQEELIRQERISLIGRMASTILHDMKNPMSAISGYAQLIKMRELPKEKLASYADIIDREVKHFSSMAQELLAFARGEGKMKPINIEMNVFLKEIVESVLVKFQEHGMKLERNLNYKGNVYIDTSRIRRALENIISNAVEAMKEGDRFTIETEQTDDKVKMKLIDTGHGMTEDVRERIFEEFFTYGKSTGTGLGMAICKRIIDDHNGTISVESMLGEGSIFTIELPIEGCEE